MPSINSRRNVFDRLITRMVVCVSVLILSYASDVHSQASARRDPISARPLSLYSGGATNAEVATGGANSAATAYCVDETKQALTPTLSSAYLRESPGEVGSPHIVVGYYNLTKGLLAGYQSAAGKRIVFRARWLSNGAISPELAHLNPANGKIEILMGQAGSWTR